MLWYAALRGLTATRAATVQLAVPVLAALGGVVVLSEAITLRLIISAAVILMGSAWQLITRPVPFSRIYTLRRPQIDYRLKP